MTFQESVQSPLAPSGEQNTDAQTAVPSAENALLAMMAQQDDQSVSNEDPASPPAQGDPQNPDSSTDPDQSGQENLPSDDTPRPDNASGDASSEPSNSLAPLLEKLDDTQRDQLKAMLKDVVDGKSGWNEIKRGHKLSGKIEELQQQIEGLKAKQTQPQDSQEPSADGLPQFDNAQSARKHEASLRRLMRDVEETLEDYPNGNVPKPTGDEPDQWKFGNQTFTRRELVDAKRRYRDQLDALPARISALDSQAAFQNRQAAIRKEIQSKWTWLADPDHPETAAVQKFISENPILKSLPSPEHAAAAFIRGAKDLERELKLRTAGASANGAGAAGSRAGARPPNGKIPVGRPHAAAGGVPARNGGQPNTKQALAGVFKDRSEDSLTRLFSAMDAAGKR